MKRHRVVVVPWSRAIGQRVLPNWLAITIGRTIIAWRDLEESELAHELEHVRQWARHGIPFPVIYLVASWEARRKGGRWYEDNRFEVAARKAADTIRKGR
jgi:hypothetical protein